MLKNENSEKSRWKRKFPKMCPKASKMVCFFKAAKSTNECKCQWLIENDLHQKSKYPGKNPQNQLKLRNLKTGLKLIETQFNQNFCGKTPGKSDTILAKYDLRPILKNVKIRKIKNAVVLFLFWGVSETLPNKKSTEANFLKIQKPNLRKKSEKRQNFNVRFTAYFSKLQKPKNKKVRSLVLFGGFLWNYFNAILAEAIFQKIWIANLGKITDFKVGSKTLDVKCLKS